MARLLTLLLTALAGAGFAALFAPDPDSLGRVATRPIASGPLPRLLARFETMPSPAEQPLALLNEGVLAQLEEGDRRWLPVAEPLPGGGTRYLYRRRPGEPELSLAEIRSLILDPPSHEQERGAIEELLHVLQRARVRVVVETPRKPGAAAEWDHAARTLRILPSTFSKGTVDFARVLNHEAIHVAQSCAAGGLRARPEALGLASDLSPELENHLGEPLYAGASPWERRLEREAYANQERLGLGAALVRSYCPLTG